MYIFQVLAPACNSAFARKLNPKSSNAPFGRFFNIENRDVLVSQIGFLWERFCAALDLWLLNDVFAGGSLGVRCVFSRYFSRNSIVARHPFFLSSLYTSLSPRLPGRCLEVVCVPRHCACAYQHRHLNLRQNEPATGAVKTYK